MSKNLPTEEELTITEIQRKIDSLIKDNEQFEQSGEYNYFVSTVKVTCQSAFNSGKIKNKEYSDFCYILKEIDDFRGLNPSLDDRKRKIKKNYLKDLIYWN